MAHYSAIISCCRCSKGYALSRSFLVIPERWKILGNLAWLKGKVETYAERARSLEEAQDRNGPVVTDATLVANSLRNKMLQLHILLFLPAGIKCTVGHIWRLLSQEFMVTLIERKSMVEHGLALSWVGSKDHARERILHHNAVAKSLTT